MDIPCIVLFFQLSDVLQVLQRNKVISSETHVALEKYEGKMHAMGFSPLCSRFQLLNLLLPQL